MPDLRASDTERDDAIGALRAHHLAALQADLPGPEPEPAPPVPARPVPRWPGVRDFAEHHELAVSARQAYDDAFDHLAPALARHGYRLVRHDGETLHFQYRRRPAWTVLVAVFTFPVGLIALLHQLEEDVVVRVAPYGRDRCRLTAHGVAPLAVRKAFARLSD